MLSERIDSEMKTAARAQDKRRLGTLRLLKSAMKYRENEKIAILEAFLPRQLTDDELSSLVQEAIAASGAKGPKEMGGVMKALMPKVAGKAEGKRVSDAVKAALAKLGA